MHIRFPFAVAALLCVTVLCGCTSQQMFHIPQAEQSIESFDDSSGDIEASFAPEQVSRPEEGLFRYRVTFYRGGPVTRLLAARRFEGRIEVLLRAGSICDSVIKTNDFEISCNISGSNISVFDARVERVLLVNDPDGCEGIAVSFRAAFSDRLSGRNAGKVWNFELSGSRIVGTTADATGATPPNYSLLNVQGEIILCSYITLVYWSDGSYDWYCWNDRNGRDAPLMSENWEKRGTLMKPGMTIWNGYRLVNFFGNGEYEGHCLR